MAEILDVIGRPFGQGENLGRGSIDFGSDHSQALIARQMREYWPA
jgi:hypothetical protein